MLIVGGRLVAAVMTLVALRMVTTFLSPEQFGELSLLVAIQMFCGLFLINPVGQYINLHTHAWWDDGTLFARLKSYRSYILWVALIGGGVALSIHRQHSINQTIFVMIIMFSMVIAGTWNATLIPMLNMLGFRGSSVLCSMVSIALGLFSSTILVSWYPTSSAWFAGQAIGLAVGAFSAKYVLSQHALDAKHSQEYLPLLSVSTVKTYCLPLAVATGLMWWQLSGYRFLIEHYWGLVQLGLLAVGMQLSSQIFALAESLTMQFFYPLFYRRINNHEDVLDDELALSDLLNTLVPLYFILTGLVIFSAPYLLKILVAQEFQNAITFVMLGACIELCRVLGNLLSNAAQIKRKTKSLTLPYAIGSITTLILIYFVAVKQMDLSWSGLAILLGACVMLMVMTIKMYQQVRFILDIRRFIAGFLTMIAMASSLTLIQKEETSLMEAVVMLLIVAHIAGLVVIALLWKNSAMLRLVNVKLRDR